RQRPAPARLPATAGRCRSATASPSVCAPGIPGCTRSFQYLLKFLPLHLQGLARLCQVLCLPHDLRSALLTHGGNPLQFTIHRYTELLYGLFFKGLGLPLQAVLHPVLDTLLGDRKSTRLNSSHVSISYAVFCLKNK